MIFLTKGDSKNGGLDAKGRIAGEENPDYSKVGNSVGSVGERSGGIVRILLQVNYYQATDRQANPRLEETGR